MTRALLVLLCAGAGAAAQDAVLSRFGSGAGPSASDGVYRLLDDDRTPGQSNAVAFPRGGPGAFEETVFACRLRVLRGGEGGAIALLDTAEYGARGPAPFVPLWTEPNLRGTFAVGLDVHNPPTEEMFGPWGNYRGEPQREVSLHWDGREIVKRLAPAEFRGDWADCSIALRHVPGGAEVTVTLAGARVYDAYFVPGLLPYESRLAIGAGTRADASTGFDVRDVRFERTTPARPRRAPLHVEVFNHVLTDNAKTAYRAAVDLPPANWAFARVTLTLEIHDAGDDWDEWDRNGEISVVADDGTVLGIVPFITSYRTECHWVVDVTHFRPWLAGRTTLEVRAGTTFYKDRGYMMSVSLDYWHGVPELEPFRVTPVWVGTARHGEENNHFRDFFEPREVVLSDATAAARLFVTTTGHSQVGEFTPSRRTVVFRCGDGPEQRFEDVLWRDDCYLNPNRPQFGTWKFSRAGWAPGDVVRPWWIDLTPHAEPGARAVLRYEPEPYDFGDGADAPAPAEVAKATHVVRAYLIEYREPAKLVAAPLLRVTGVADGSNAARAGVRAGDRLASYDGRRLDSLDDLRAAIGAAAERGAESVVVVVWRGAERLELALEPGRMGVNLAAR